MLKGEESGTLGGMNKETRLTSMASISGAPRPLVLTGPGWSSPLQVQAETRCPGRLIVSACSLAPRHVSRQRGADLPNGRRTYLEIGPSSVPLVKASTGPVPATFV
jgi:hypothetical protein